MEQKNDHLRGTVHVAIPGRHLGTFDVYELEDRVYLAIPRETFRTELYPPEYEEFYLTKAGRYWKTNIVVEDVIVGTIVEELNLK